jgi:endonuclease/exonuclease/phosphatase family metal-dependent hydrolase
MTTKTSNPTMIDLKYAGHDWAPIMMDLVRREAVMLHKMVHCLAIVVGFLAMNLAHADPPRLNVATWNMAWLMGRDTFNEWRAFCAGHNWRPATSVEPKKPLPFCDVHSGMTFPLEPCLRTNDPASLANPPVSFPGNHPCRESLELRSWPKYSKKLTQLRTMASKLKNQGVEVVFLQEVYDRQAAKQIFRAANGWKVVTSAELSGALPIAQQVGVAYRGSARLVGAAKLIKSLAVTTDGGRSVRPGLEVSFKFGDDAIDFLVVHLKSGCRSDIVDAPEIRQRVDEPTVEFEQRAAAKRESCATLRKQVPELEAWIDEKAQAQRWYAVVGDFNRTLLQDGFDPSRARLPESDSTDARDPITNATKIARLTPELSDGAPPGARLFLARADYRPLANTELCKSRLRGIDHFALGARLSDEIGGIDQLDVAVIGYGAAAFGKDKALPSDHCPHLMLLQAVP